MSTGGKNGCASQDVLGPDHLTSGIEIDLFAGLDIHAGNREARVAPVQTLEVNEPVQGSKKGRVVE